MSGPLEIRLQQFVERLRADLGSELVTVCLFGSQVDGAAEGRDVDVLVVWEGAPKRRWARSEPIRAAARVVSPELEHWLMSIVLTRDEAREFKPYYLGILTRHRLLLDRNGFFESVLARLQARLDELGARRLRDADGYEYWDLVPDWKPGDEVRI